MILHLVVNGRSHELDVSPGETLLQVLRERLGMPGTKEGCGVGECGACTVSISGRPRVACVTLAATVQGEVETIERLTARAPGLQKAFAAKGGLQCGFCRCTGYAGIVRAHRRELSRDSVKPGSVSASS